jgi:hypothetical protein
MLGRLTWDEARITAPQTLEVLYVLVQSMNVVMAGVITRWACRQSLRTPAPRRQSMCQRCQVRV